MSNVDAFRAALRDALPKLRSDGQLIYPTENDIDTLVDQLVPHLTPAPETAEAPAVDDDLLRDLRVQITLRKTDLSLDHIREWLSSQPMQRLRAAWTADAEERAESYRRQVQQWSAERALQGDARVEVERLRAELTAINERWNRAYSEAVKDMAVGWKADVERLRAAQQTGDLEEALWHVLRQSAPRPFPDNLVDAVRQLCAQAAQQLPDVGPVERGSGETGGGFWVDGVHFGEWSGRSYLREGARYLAVAAFLDAEAADTSSDDEVQELAKVLADADVEGFRGYGVMARAVIAHRARGGQEAGPRRCKPDCGCLDGTNVRVESGECAVFDENGETRVVADRDR